MMMMNSPSGRPTYSTFSPLRRSKGVPSYTGQSSSGVRERGMTDTWCNPNSPPSAATTHQLQSSWEDRCRSFSCGSSYPQVHHPAPPPPPWTRGGGLALQPTIDSFWPAVQTRNKVGKDNEGLVESMTDPKVIHSGILNCGKFNCGLWFQFPPSNLPDSWRA